MQAPSRNFTVRTWWPGDAPDQAIVQEMAGLTTDEYFELVDGIKEIAKNNQLRVMIEDDKGYVLTIDGRML